MKPVRNLLFIRFSAIGDIVECVPLLRALKQRLGCRITWLTVKGYEGVLADCPYVDEVIAVERPFRRARFGMHWWDARRSYGSIRDLQKRRFDAVVNYQRNARSYVIELFTQPSLSRRLRAFRDLLAEGLTPPAVKKRRQQRRLALLTAHPEASRHLVFMARPPLDEFGISQYDDSLEFFLNDSLRGFADEFLAGHSVAPSPARPLIGINPGVNWESKQYFEHRYAAAADALVQADNADILIFGGPEDVEKANAVLAAMKQGDRAVSCAGQTPSANHAAALIARCSLFITNDTGLMHLAAALGVPTISIFGGTHPGLHAPIPQPGVPHIHLCKGQSLPCWPCYRYHCKISDNRACLKPVTPDDILSAARGILSPPTVKK